uniref:Gbx homeobox protein n=1 Tax=Nemertoderma westbladi TaxID=172109 RepID=A0A2P1DVF9_9BILA|nr:Gbx homeobox protein [Nemertoderma westbladi]
MQHSLSQSTKPISRGLLADSTHPIVTASSFITTYPPLCCLLPPSMPPVCLNVCQCHGKPTHNPLNWTYGHSAQLQTFCSGTPPQPVPVASLTHGIYYNTVGDEYRITDNITSSSNQVSPRTQLSEDVSSQTPSNSHTTTTTPCRTIPEGCERTGQANVSKFHTYNNQQPLNLIPISIREQICLNKRNKLITNETTISLQPMNNCHGNVPPRVGNGSLSLPESSDSSADTPIIGYRRKRTSFSSSQLRELEKHFNRKKYLSVPDRTLLANILHLTQPQIKVWFQNRRAKWKRIKAGSYQAATSGAMTVSTGHKLVVPIPIHVGPSRTANLDQQRPPLA